jgi:phosphorylcholine metabolism protein LicD
MSSPSRLLPQIFPRSQTVERERMKQILKIQILAKFCHIAENLGATALAFKSSYQNARTEILGLFNTMSNYQVLHVKKFYEEISNKDNDYIAKVYGHPPLVLQEQETRKVLDVSCRHIRNDFSKIGIQ